MTMNPSAVRARETAEQTNSQSEEPFCVHAELVGSRKNLLPEISAYRQEARYLQEHRCSMNSPGDLLQPNESCIVLIGSSG